MSEIAPSTRPPVAGARARSAYAVTAVRYGTLRTRKSRLFHRYESYGDPDAEAEMAYYFWLLERGDEVTLVDCGFDPEVGRRRGRTPLVSQREALERLGIAPARVARIIVTHFHYDHVGGLAQFPQAEVLVPERELEFWGTPLARRHQFAAHVEPAELAVIEDRLKAGSARPYGGGTELLPGVRAFDVGGHSPGQQMLLVRTAGRPVLLTSDAVHFYEEYERDRPFAVIADLGAMYRAYDLIGALAADESADVVPGHDPQVLSRYEQLADAPFAARVSSRE